MIATLIKRGGRQEYVALHLDERTHARKVWVTIRGDRGSAGEQTSSTAAWLCVLDMHRRYRDMAALARKLCKELGNCPEARATAWVLHDMLERQREEMMRLFDAPTHEDDVEIDGDYMPVDPGAAPEHDPMDPADPFHPSNKVIAMIALEAADC